MPHDGHAIGEIVARGDGVMEGYWSSRATARRSPARRLVPLRRHGHAQFEEGYLLIVDRKKDIIVSGGENISSLESRKHLVAHPAVCEVAVIPVPDRSGGKFPRRWWF